MLLLQTIFPLLIGIMNFMEYLLMGYIILGWFIFFGVVKDRDGVFFKVYVFLMSKIEPLLAFIRQYLPNIAGLDFSPLVIFVALHFAKVIMLRLYFMVASY